MIDLALSANFNVDILSWRQLEAELIVAMTVVLQFELPRESCRRRVSFESR